MQKAEVILSLLGQKAEKDPLFRFARIYRNLYNPTFYPQDDPKRLAEMIEQLRWERFTPEPIHNPRIQDLWVQTALTRLLKAIYRPYLRFYNMKIPEIVKEIRDQCRSAGFVISGRLTDSEEITVHSRLISYLQKKIDDGRFLHFIQRFLLADYLSGDLSFSQVLKEIYFLMIKDWFQQHKPDSFVHFAVAKQDFCIFLNVSKKEAKELAQQLKKHFSLLQSLQVIDWSKKSLHLWGYAIRKRNGRVELQIPEETMDRQLAPFRKNGKPSSVANRLYLSVPNLIQLYDQEYRQFCDTFIYAENFKSQLKKFRYYHYHSLLKTIARKEQISMRKVIEKYRDKGSRIHVLLRTKSGDWKKISYGD